MADRHRAGQAARPAARKVQCPEPALLILLSAANSRQWTSRNAAGMNAQADVADPGQNPADDEHVANLQQSILEESRSTGTDSAAQTPGRSFRPRVPRVWTPFRRGTVSRSRHALHPWYTGHFGRRWNLDGGCRASADYCCRLLCAHWPCRWGADRRPVAVGVGAGLDPGIGGGAGRWQPNAVAGHFVDNARSHLPQRSSGEHTRRTATAARCATGLSRSQEARTGSTFSTRRTPGAGVTTHGCWPGSWQRRHSTKSWSSY